MPSNGLGASPPTKSVKFSRFQHHCLCEATQIAPLTNTDIILTNTKFRWLPTSYKGRMPPDTPTPLAPTLATSAPCLPRTC